MASKRFGRKIKYRVRWEGYEQQDDTWEPIENLRNSTDTVKEFHQTHPQALRDPRLCYKCLIFLPRSTQALRDPTVVL